MGAARLPVRAVGPPPRSGNRGLITAVVALIVVLLPEGWRSPVAAELLVDRPAETTDVAPSVSAPGGIVPGARRRKQRTSAAAPRPPSVSSAPAPTPGQGPGQSAALATLTWLRVASVARLPQDGRWVAQAAAKYMGVSDPLETLANRNAHLLWKRDLCQRA